MRHLAIILGLVLLATGVLPPATHGANTSPGRLAAFAAEQLVALPGGGDLGEIASATIAKGRRYHALVADLTLVGANHGGSPTQYLLAVEVNGVRMEPTTGSTVQVDCGASAGVAHPCAFSGIWWLDLDEAERMHPGKFVRELLTIRVLAADVVNDGFQSPTDVATHVSLFARMVEK